MWGFSRCVYAPDPFADATKGDDRLPAGTEDYIHIRIQQRNGRKTLTTVQGIADDYDKKKLVKAFKKVRSHLAQCAQYTRWHLVLNLFTARPPQTDIRVIFKEVYLTETSVAL